MAWIDKKKRSDGGVSARVVWRLGGCRDGAYQSETFSAATDAVNMERARGFKSMVDAAGQRWPEGWVRGEGFVRPSGTDPMRRPPRFDEIGEEYVRQIVDLSPGQRKRYLGQLRVLASTRVQGELVFTKPVTSITEADLRAWLSSWDRSVKTKANYHGLIHGVFAYAIAQGWLSVSPTVRTALKGWRVRQSRPELRFLTEAECEAVVRLAGPYGDLIAVAVGTGLRYGEITALWVSAVDLTRRTIRVSKAWKREGEAGAHDTPTWLTKSLTAKHAMREHYLGNPKTAKSRRTISISPVVAAVLARQMAGKNPDDFVFITRLGRPLHNGDFHTHVWRKLMKALAAEGIAPFRFHDLRHTHVAWLVAGGAPLPHIQAMTGARVDHHHDRHLRPPAPRRRRAHLRDRRHGSVGRRCPTRWLRSECCEIGLCATQWGERMIFDHIEWDEHNLDHATKRLTAAEIEQAIINADRMLKHPRDSDRGRIESVTDGGKRVVVIVQLVRDGVRPITGWEA